MGRKLRHLFYTVLFFLKVGSLIIPNPCFSQEKTKVYLLGTFHFAQTDTLIYDVRNPQHQRDIEQLTSKIVGLMPDKIFVERMPEWEHQNRVDSLYQEYRKGGLRRSRNEIWQVGARAAAILNHPHIYQCDHPGRYGFYYGQISTYANAHGQQDKLRYHGPGITAPLTSLINTDSLLNSVSLLEYIKWLNSKEVQQTSHAHYINVYPQIGNTNVFHYDSTYFLGTELTADWYRRNILIYAKILAQLNYSEKAIFLIIGNDHVPIIRQMFQANPFFEVIAAENWLGKSEIKVPTRQPALNMRLKRELDSVLATDQHYRKILTVLTSKDKVDSIARIYVLDPKQVVNHFAKLQTAIDSSNLHFIEDVIKKHGYPGNSSVGSETNEVAWYILQHSNKVGQYLPLIKEAGQKGELNMTRVAMMEDRYLMYQGKEQIYGTQGSYKTLKDGTSQMIIYPIKDPKNVNKRRRKLGFTTTVEEQAKNMNITYRVIRLSDIKIN